MSNDPFTEGTYDILHTYQVFYIERLYLASPRMANGANRLCSLPFSSLLKTDYIPKAKPPRSIPLFNHFLLLKLTMKVQLSKY